MNYYIARRISHGAWVLINHERFDVPKSYSREEAEKVLQTIAPHSGSFGLMVFAQVPVNSDHTINAPREEDAPVFVNCVAYNCKEEN